MFSHHPASLSLVLLLIGCGGEVRDQLSTGDGAPQGDSKDDHASPFDAECGQGDADRGGLDADEPDYAAASRCDENDTAEACDARDRCQWYEPACASSRMIVTPAGCHDEGSAPPLGIACAAPAARSELPVTREDVEVLGPDLGIASMSALFVLPDGRLRLFWDAHNRDASDAGVFASYGGTSTRFARAERVALGSGASIVGSVSVVGDDLYWVESREIFAMDATIHRTPVDPRGVPVSSRSERVAGLDGSPWMLSWPKFKASTDGVIVAFQDESSRPHFSSSLDGLLFERPRHVGGHQWGSIPHVNQFPTGELVYTYQHEIGTSPMQSHHRISRDDGLSWTPPRRSADPGASNVHDASTLARRDGAGIDLYYIYSGAAPRFVLYRRSLRPDGTLGLEQRVTSDELGEPSKPTAYRLPSGDVLLTWAEIAERDPVTREPIVQRQIVTRLSDDAPIR